jgi:DNA (cytosine-5)-methyltransferase 1
VKVGSAFTGVGGADLGFEWAGYDIAWQCEFDAWKQQVLRAHWPDVQLYDDITTMQDPEPVDVMIGGFPCQDLSVAGKRKGFDGERSVLAFEFLRVAESIRPRWLVLENVPGLLSSNKGLDFQRLLNEVVACGYGVGWRCLDARYFSVAQRRRRILLVARRAEAGIDTRAAAGLALRALCESGSGDPTPSWPPRQEAPAFVGVGVESGGGGDISPAVTAKWKKGTGGPAGDECQNLVTYRKSKRAQTDQDDETWVEADETNTLNRFDTGDTRATQLIANALDRQAGGPDDNSAQAGYLVSEQTMVRRLTPLECERLMGLPDNFTAPEGVKAPDTRRYAACGDAIVTWVAYWIAQRINKIEQETA